MGSCGGGASSFRAVVSLEEEWRYLGMIQNGLGECDKMVNDLRDEMNDAAENKT